MKIKRLLKLIFILIVVVVCFMNTECGIIYKARKHKHIDNSWVSVIDSSRKYTAILFCDPEFDKSSFAIYKNKTFLRAYTFVGGGSLAEIEHEICEIMCGEIDESIIMSNNRLQISKVVLLQNNEKQVMEIKPDQPFVIIVSRKYEKLLFYDQNNNEYSAILMKI